eukprot:SAG25_NODE_9465_length_371_cov_0.952206_1_plen_47_part_01
MADGWDVAALARLQGSGGGEGSPRQRQGGWSVIYVVRRFFARIGSPC